MAALPLFKMGMLAVRSLSKPLATRVKTFAQTHPRFRRVCAWSGQTWHVVVSKINVRLLGHKISKVKPLGEADAVARGADFFGEFFIYSVSASVVVVEYRRSDREKEQKALEKLQRQRVKEERQKRQMQAVDRRMADLWEETGQLRKLIEELKKQNEASAQRRWSWY